MGDTRKPRKTYVVRDARGRVVNVTTGGSKLSQVHKAARDIGGTVEEGVGPPIHYAPDPPPLATYTCKPYSVPVTVSSPLLRASTSSVAPRTFNLSSAMEVARRNMAEELGRGFFSDDVAYRTGPVIRIPRV